MPTEHQEHVTLARYLDLIEATTHGFFWSTIRHGTAMSPAARGQRKAAGTKPGMPDILITFNGRPVFIELKRSKGGEVSEAQRECHQRLMLAGAVVVVAKGAGPAIDFVKTNLLGGK